MNILRKGDFMNFEEFKNIIIYYMNQKGWTVGKAIDGSNRLALEKNYNPSFNNKPKAKFLIDDKEYYSKLEEGIKKLNIPHKNFNSIDNKFDDTDFIVAGLQTINPIINGEEDNNTYKWYSYQPVIRMIDKDKCGTEEGYFSSFINICEISTKTDILEYLEDIDKWIDILSNCSLHVSGLQLILKSSTTAYNGVGVEFNYKGLELGQANIYKINVNGEERMFSDFGFGYERILWAINGGTNFYAPFVSKYDYLFGDLKEVDRIRTTTLMAMSGIKASSSGKGKHIRGLIKDIENIETIPNIDNQIKKYYNFYAQFIEPIVELKEVEEVINTEIEFNIKKKVLERLNISNYSPLMKKDIEEICEKVFLEELYERTNIKKNKGIKVRSL